jgi:hypothetical protein
VDELDDDDEEDGDGLSNILMVGAVFLLLG